MKSEYIDLYIIHAPWGMKPTEAVPGADFPYETATGETGNDIFDDYELVDVWAANSQSYNLSPTCLEVAPKGSDQLKRAKKGLVVLVHAQRQPGSIG